MAHDQSPRQGPSAAHRSSFLVPGWAQLRFLSVRDTLTEKPVCAWRDRVPPVPIGMHRTSDAAKMPADGSGSNRSRATVKDMKNGSTIRLVTIDGDGKAFASAPATNARRAMRFEDRHGAEA
jgi:hypothetical protein